MVEDWQKMKELKDIKKALHHKLLKCIDEIKLPGQLEETLKELQTMRRQRNLSLQRSGLNEVSNTGVVREKLYQ